MPVLVTYASRPGSTRGIAERIAQRLRADGLETDVRPAAEVRDPSRYDAFVVGPAAYLFHWLKEANAFVRSNQELLAERPTWLFSSGPLGTDLVDKQGRDVLETSIPREFPALQDAICPRGEKVFFGAMDPSARPIGLAERFLSLMPAGKDALPTGDFRDWPAIDAWADEIAHDLGANGAPVERAVAQGVAAGPVSPTGNGVTVARSAASAGSREMAAANPSVFVKPIVATLVEIPAAAIALGALTGAAVPVVGDGAAALVALWILGSVMCAMGISATRERFGALRPWVVGMPLGLLATLLVISGLFGWPLLLQPIVDALGGPGSVSLARAAIVGAGSVMVVKWLIAWLACLPRSIVPAAAS